jgi:hypothetical protein
VGGAVARFAILLTVYTTGEVLGASGRISRRRELARDWRENASVAHVRSIVVGWQASSGARSGTAAPRLELQDRSVGLATSVALALLGLRLGHPLDVSPEVLPRHNLLDRLLADRPWR